MTFKCPELDWSYQPLSEALQTFKARINLYIDDNKIETATTKL